MILPPNFSPFDDDAASFISWVEGTDIDDTADNRERYISGIQAMINSGLAWKLQGAYGRSAMRLINQGFCYPPTLKRKDMH